VGEGVVRLLFEVEGLAERAVTFGVEVQSGVAAEKLVAIGDQVWAWMIIVAQRHLLAWSCDG
jgi:hypothetical protein